MNGVSIFTIDQAKHTSLAILGTACFVCSNIPDELLRCQDCKRLSYCSAACKKADFKPHKKICSALQRAPLSTPSHLRRKIFERGDTPYDLEPHIAKLIKDEEIAFMKIIGPREYTRIHRDLFLYEPRCAVCLRSAADMRSTVDPEYKSLLYCLDCRAAFACSEEHRAEYLDEHCRRLEDGESFTECEMNKRAYEHSLEIVARGWVSKDTLWFPMRRKNEYTPLLPSWDEWFADPSNLSPLDSSPVLNRIRTKQLSIPLTVLYGIEKFDKEAGELPLLSSRTELEIAVVGAMEYEIMFGGMTCFEEILHNLPSLRRLTVRLIGPDVSRGLVGPKGVSRKALDKRVPCALCKEKGVELVHSVHEAMFHDYVKKGTTQAAANNGPAFKWPDIAVMFNSGMGLNVGRKSDWTPTLEMLAENGVPTLCTSFMDREADEDEDYLNLHRCNIVIKRHKNPWRSEVVNKMVFMRKRFFSYNAFIQGFRGWRKKDNSSTSAAHSALPMDDDMVKLFAMMLSTSREFRLGKGK